MACLIVLSCLRHQLRLREYITGILEMSWEDHLSEVRIGSSGVVFSSLSCVITLSVITEIPEKSFLCFS